MEIFIGVVAHPLKEVEDQGLDGVCHRGSRGLARVAQYIASFDTQRKASCDRTAVRNSPEGRGSVSLKFSQKSVASRKLALLIYLGVKDGFAMVGPLQQALLADPKGHAGGLIHASSGAGQV